MWSYDDGLTPGNQLDSWFAVRKEPQCPKCQPQTMPKAIVGKKREMLRGHHGIPR
jgi:hypothetical protein